jgi:Zn finger protein HypA/HybF involved in hydrogenase expression
MEERIEIETDMSTLSDMVFAKDEFEFEIRYIKVKCKKCFNSWGITVNGNTFKSEDMVCRECAKKQISRNRANR